MIKVNCEYNIKEDIDFILESEKMNILEFSEKTKVSRTTLDSISKNTKPRDDVYEKIYSYAYENKYRINSVKEDLIKEKYQNVLFHGSKKGLSEITIIGARENCDFGKGFYLGETYSQALSFVCEMDKSSVYSFKYTLENLNIKRFQCDLEWMIAICYYRGKLRDYSSNPIVDKIVTEIEMADVVIAPIADNKMFYMMAQFIDGEINADVALHSLSASKLGFQFVFKTEKSLNNLVPIEKYYISLPEREDCRKLLNDRSYEIDTKLKLAKREFRAGLYIEEILK